MQMPRITTRTFEAPGATITYDVRGDLADGTPLLLVASPMGAEGFTALAPHFADRPVVTYDPRGAGRSPRTDGRLETVPQEHADDLHRLIDALGVGPVDVFASSGGAVNALVLVEQRPGDVRTLVAHEPPLAEYLPDRDAVLATGAAIRSLYDARGFGPAMAKFIELASLEGEVPMDYPEREAPDPAMFGLPTIDDGSRDDPLLGLNLPSAIAHVPDLEALRAAPTCIVVAAGEESMKVMTGRAAAALAEALGVPLTMFPSHHAGFLGEATGMQGKPDEFAARLREVLG